MREADLERKCVKLAKERGGLLLKWTCPGYAGVPDRLLFYMGYIVPIEFKRPTGRLSKMQEIMIRRIEDTNNPVFVIRHVSEMEHLLDEMDGGIHSEVDEGTG